jgi:hypothetical protein
MSWRCGLSNRMFCKHEGLSSNRKEEKKEGREGAGKELRYTGMDQTKRSKP